MDIFKKKCIFIVVPIKEEYGRRNTYPFRIVQQCTCCVCLQNMAHSL